MFCTNCGSQVAEAHAFCTHCGTKVRQAASPVTETATAPRLWPPERATFSAAPSAPPSQSGPIPNLPRSAEFVKRAVSEKEAELCNTWANGGVTKKVGEAGAFLLTVTGVVSGLGALPAVIEFLAMGVLLPLCFAAYVDLRIKRHAVAKIAEAAFAVDVTGAPRVERSLAGVSLRVGDVAFVVAGVDAPKLLGAAGTGGTTFSCVVAASRRRTAKGLLTATGGDMLKAPLRTKVVGL